MGSRRKKQHQRDIPDDESGKGSLASRLAIFGDSNVALLASFLMLLVAVFVALSMDDCNSSTPHAAAAAAAAAAGRSKSPTKRDFVKSSKQYAATIHEFNGDTLVSTGMLQDYNRDGVIAIRGLLDTDLLDQLDVASQKVVDIQKLKPKKGGGTQFFQVEVGIALENEAFRNVALGSRIPTVAAVLLQLVTSNSTVRMMRDIFLVKDDDQYICGWHTDDTGFWPATAAAPGVNAWIALDDMPTTGGGGFALAVGSHAASWRKEAHTVTGSTRTLPVNGFRDVADMFANRTGAGTCNVKTSAPHLHAQMEESMRVYEIKKGDVIFHDRWLFHRTVPFDKQFARQMDGPLYRRYSVRYGPGSSIVPPGYGLELSALWNAENAGRSADEVSKRDGPWYPQCWPSMDATEMEQLPILMRDKMSVAKAARKVRQKEMKPYLAEMRKKHS